MTEIKTLKDMPEALSTVQHPFKEWVTWNFIEKIIREEVIKWVKEDLNVSSISHEAMILELKWMKRFNIAEEDLK